MNRRFFRHSIAHQISAIFPQVPKLLELIFTVEKFMAANNRLFPLTPATNTACPTAQVSYEKGKTIKAAPCPHWQKYAQV
jgi:hypothetical protein